MNQHINRRSWLKTAGILGSTAPLITYKGFSSIAEPNRSLIADGPIRLNANENPYGPSLSVKEAITSNWDQVCRYPFGAIRDLEKLIAEKENLSPENVVITGGSREGLNACGLLFGMNNGEIISCVPTYESLLRYAQNFGAYISEVPLDENRGFDLDAIARRVTGNTHLVFICNPNNPTGTILDADRLRSFCKDVSKQTLVFVDEAYIDYIEGDYPSMSNYVKQGANVIVSRTFSKIYGLAGLRIGYLLAREDLADRLRKALMASSNMMAVIAATAAIKDQSFYQQSASKNEQCKNLLYQTFDNLNLEYSRSHTNFVFFKTGMPIGDVQQKYRDKGILVGRPFPPFYEWCRISTGAVEDVQVFCDVTKSIFTA